MQAWRRASLLQSAFPCSRKNFRNVAPPHDRSGRNGLLFSAERRLLMKCLFMMLRASPEGKIRDCFFGQNNVFQSETMLMCSVLFPQRLSEVRSLDGCRPPLMEHRRIPLCWEKKNAGLADRALRVHGVHLFAWAWSDVSGKNVRSRQQSVFFLFSGKKEVRPPNHMKMFRKKEKSGKKFFVNRKQELFFAKK